MNHLATCTLIGEWFSPWTQKARWALEYCGVAYRYIEYTPTLSEPTLRWRIRQWSGPVSVPVLLLGRQSVRGSWEIARYADAQAGDGRLGDFAQIAAWNELSEAALAEARTRVVRRVLDNPTALEKAMPGLVPPMLRCPLRFVARDAARRLDRKYAHLAVPGALRHALERTRDSLGISGSDYLLGGAFSYADIAMAVVLETLAPVARTEPPLGPATRRCWSDPALAESSFPRKRACFSAAEPIIQGLEPSKPKALDVRLRRSEAEPAFAGMTSKNPAIRSSLRTSSGPRSP